MQPACGGNKWTWQNKQKRKITSHTWNTTNTTCKWHHADARVHYTVLTQHPEPATNTTTINGIHQPVRHTKKGDNAPDTQQCTNDLSTTLLFVCMDTFTHVTKHCLNTWYCWLRCVSYPEFPNSVAAEHLPTQPPTHHQLCGQPTTVSH